MNILLSAYACEPLKGSEPGVGWRWATELSALGHHVWVITRSNNQEAIEFALTECDTHNLFFLYFDLPNWSLFWKKWPGGVYIYNLIWQVGAYLLAARCANRIRFDWVQHITFGVFRQPSLMGLLGIPFIFGPVGGGERAPYNLRKSFPIRGRILDKIRDIFNSFARINPLTRFTYQKANIILCKTKETLLQLPASCQNKSRVQIEIGIDTLDKPTAKTLIAGDFRLLYVGRLIYWKGLHLALLALARVRLINTTVRLTVIGSGPDEVWFHELTRKLGIAEAVDWHPWLPRYEVMAMYKQHDAFVFPSLHDSSGNVVLEALSCGLPVICLDLGGPAFIVDESCGIVINTFNSSEDDVVNAITHSIILLLKDVVFFHTIAEGAFKRALRFSWRHAVTSVYPEDK